MPRLCQVYAKRKLVCIRSSLFSPKSSDCLQKAENVMKYVLSTFSWSHSPVNSKVDESTHSRYWQLEAGSWKQFDFVSLYQHNSLLWVRASDLTFKTSAAEINLISEYDGLLH